MGTEILNARHGVVNDSRSAHSGYYPSGKFPKVSIGIMVDKIPVSRKNGIGASGGQTPGLCKEKTIGENGNLGKKGILGGKQTEPGDKVDVACVSSRRQNHVTADVPLEKCSVPIDIPVSSSQRRGKEEHVQRTKEVEVHEMHAMGNERKTVEIENMIRAKNEDLRMKLWETLGSSPKKGTQSPVLKEVTAIPNREKVRQNESPESLQAKQNSDTIETDLESPGVAVGRPVTRSLARKNAPTKTLPKMKLDLTNTRSKFCSMSASAEKSATEKDVFSFKEEAEKAKLSNLHVNNKCAWITRKRSNRHVQRVEPRRISFPKRSISSKTPQHINRDQPEKSSEDAKLEGIGLGATSLSPCKVESRLMHQLNEICKATASGFKKGSQVSLQNPPSEENLEREKNSDGPLSKGATDYVNQTKKSVLSQDSEEQENINSPTSSKKTQSHNDTQSPTLAVNIKSAALKDKHMEQISHSITDAARSSGGQSSEPSVSLNSKLDSSDSEPSLEGSGHKRDSSKSPVVEMPTFMKDKATENYWRNSDSENTLVNEFINKGLRSGFVDIKNPMKSPITRHCKRLRSIDTEDHSRGPPSFVFGMSRTVEADPLIEDSEQLQEESLARSISQLGVVLEQFKAKVKLRTNKKNSDLLSSVGDRIRLQLHDVDSQIQADIRQFTSLAKTKRKYLESTCREQQEKLNSTYEKFKTEINQHLTNCRSTFEELEAFQKEMKANTECQRASHRELLVQVEEAMQVQLSDAEKSMSAIQQAARKRMNGLKHVLKAWLSEGTQQ